MIVKQKSKVIPIEKSSTHYKMYKGGKLWLTAGITTLSMAGMMVATGELQTAHADTTTTANNTQQTATGGNAVTATTSGTSGQAGTITQPVNIDHSQLNNAVDQARQAGLTVNQQPTTTQTVSQDQVDAAKQNIQNDETKQAQRIQTITRQHQTEVSNVNNFNGSKGDTSQLDARVKEAQSIPGLTVVHDQDQTTVKKASDTQGIQEAVNNATQSNNDQAQSIQNAIDTQKRNKQEYDNALKDYNQQMQNLSQDQIKHDSGTFTWPVPGHPLSQYYAKVNWSADITWHWDVAQKAVIVTKVNVTFDRVNPNHTGGGFWDAFVFMNPNTNVPQEAGTYLQKQGDIPGINGDSLWQKIGGGGNSGIFAFYTQKNSTHEYTIKYDFNNSVPFKAVDNHDGTWTVLKSVIRQNDGGVGSGANALFHILWHNNDTKVTVNPNIPTMPTFKTTEVHYHYNTSVITSVIRL